VASEVVGRLPVATHGDGLEVVERTVPLTDEFDLQVAVLVDLPTELVSWFDVEPPPEGGRDGDHPPVAHGGLLGSTARRHARR